MTPEPSPVTPLKYHTDPWYMKIVEKIQHDHDDNMRLPSNETRTYEILKSASICLYHRDTLTYSDDGAFERAEYTVISSFEAWYLVRET